MSSSTNLKEEMLSEFRGLVEDFTPEECLNDDAFLLRWLIARDFNLDKSVYMLKSYFEWRKDNEIDTILEWEPADDIKKACPYEISGYDLDGRPVLVFPYAKWTPWEFTDTNRRAEYLKYMDQMLEKCVAKIKPPASQFVILADSDGFSFRHMSRLKALDANLEALKGFETHYPEMMKMAFVVNCPKVFSILYSIIKPLMSKTTQEKLQLHDFNSRRWHKALNNFIAQNQLPAKYRSSEEKESQIAEDNSSDSSGDMSKEILR